MLRPVGETGLREPFSGGNFISINAEHLKNSHNEYISGLIIRNRGASVEFRGAQLRAAEWAREGRSEWTALSTIFQTLSLLNASP